MPQFQFNSQGIDPQYGGMGGLPFGRHPVVISGSQLKPTKDGQGGYMELILTAIDGPAKDMSDVDRLNLHNKSTQAVEIANKQLSAYCHVTGVFAFNTTEELHNKPFVVEIVPRKDNPQQGEIGKLFDINGNEPGKSGAGQQQTGGFGGGQPNAAIPPQQGNQGGGWGGAPATGGDQGQQQQQGGGQPGWSGGAPQGGNQAGNGPGWSQGQQGGNQGGGAPWGQR